MHEITQAVNEGHCWVCDAGGVVAGYATLHYQFFSNPFLGLLITGADFRRQGIGSALVNAIEQTLPKPGKLFTSTNESNQPMQALLHKAGFRPTGRVEGLDDGDPEIFYLKILS